MQSDGGLSEKDIERMIQQAKENEEADKKRRKLVETRNAADSFVFETEEHFEES